MNVHSHVRAHVSQEGRLQLEGTPPDVRVVRPNNTLGEGTKGHHYAIGVLSAPAEAHDTPANERQRGHLGYTELAVNTF
eukprot:6172607-Pleurochrysis_carterae.AAC.1